jgi:membrane fusion protein (multidrug efflux system)
MKLKVTAAVLIVLLVVSVLGGIKALQIRKLIETGAAAAPPPETISAAVVVEEKWQDSLTAIGSITAVQGVTITPEVPGSVSEIAFEAGAVVAQGDVLVRFDTSSELAQLKALEAQAEWAKANVERMRKLRTENTVAVSELDQAEASYKQASANADAIRAVIAKKTIRAPFAGRLGVRQINLGQYLEAGKPIVSLQSLDRVFADFSHPQQNLASLKTGMKVLVTTDTYPDQKFEGVLTTINPGLDQDTRSIGLQATLDNPGQLLRPGMFARIEVLLPGEETVAVIPATSVLSAPYGDSVYVIESKPDKEGKPALTVRQQLVRTGRARGDLVVVETGLKPGDRIVNAGLFKLRNGMPVVENNELAPKSVEKPHPSDS